MTSDYQPVYWHTSRPSRTAKNETTGPQRRKTAASTGPRRTHEHKTSKTTLNNRIMLRHDAVGTSALGFCPQTPVNKNRTSVMTLNCRCRLRRQSADEKKHSRMSSKTLNWAIGTWPRQLSRALLTIYCHVIARKCIHQILRIRVFPRVYPISLRSIAPVRDGTKQQKPYRYRFYGITRQTVRTAITKKLRSADMKAPQRYWQRSYKLKICSQHGLVHLPCGAWHPASRRIRASR